MAVEDSRQKLNFSEKKKKEQKDKQKNIPVNFVFVILRTDFDWQVVIINSVSELSFREK